MEPYQDAEGIIRLSIGDVNAAGDKRELLYATVKNTLGICEVNADSKRIQLKCLNSNPNNKGGNYPVHEKNIVGAYFFDLDDIGTHGILLETKDAQLKGYIYLSDGSTYFLKALSYDNKGEGQKRTGQARVGVSYQYLMTNIDGKELLRTGHQATSNAYRNLQLPYMLDGVGRCQNYIEYFSFGHYPEVIH